MVRVPTLDFIAAGGNPYPAIADVDPRTGFVAFGADQNVAAWQPASDAAGRDPGIKALLSGHTATVTAVKCWRLKNRTLLVSGSADATVRLWSPVLKHNSANGFRCCSVLRSHTKSVNAIACLEGSNVFVTAGADGEVKVWRVRSDDAVETLDGSHDLDVEMLQSFSTKPTFIPMTVALARIPGSKGLVIATAGTKVAIQVYIAADDAAGPAFKQAATLSGHEGWVRALDFTVDPASKDYGELLLASASQDRYIRLWRLQAGGRAISDTKDSAVSKFDPVATMIGGAMSNKAHRFTVQPEPRSNHPPAQSKAYAITFEALLVGHEDWIFSAKWLTGSPTLRLLTASADNSLSIWEPEEASGVWTCTVRLGEMSAQKGATTATGSAGGFWTGLWLNGGKAVMCLGKTGGWRLWRHDDEKDRWEQDLAVTGHTQSVQGLAWAPNGSYLLSTSTDKTTRLWAPTTQGTWHEISRPQIHGYDLSCIDTISNSRFMSGADEKLLRVFDQPKAVADRLSSACGIEISADTTPAVHAANMPVLGLSNKAIDPADDDEAETDEQQQQQQQAQPNNSVPLDNIASTTIPPAATTTAPTEDTLSRFLLWPETEKLYGHSYEISACAVSPSGTLVATACKASSVPHASVRIYRTSDWRLAQPPLEAHSLTVARLRWSEDDKFLVSVARDRSCAVFRREQQMSAKGTEEASYKLLEGCPVKVHARMVLDVAWLPIDNEEGRYSFVTAGRDKVISIWQLRKGVLETANAGADAEPEAGKDTNPLEQRLTQTATAPVTAVDCISSSRRGHALLAYGLEDGSVTVLELVLGEQITVVGSRTLAKELSPSSAVTQLAWRPPTSDAERDADGAKRMLAVASEDASVRLFSFGVEDGDGEQDMNGSV